MESIITIAAVHEKKEAVFMNDKPNLSVQTCNQSIRTGQDPHPSSADEHITKSSSSSLLFVPVDVQGREHINSCWFNITCNLMNK